MSLFPSSAALYELGCKARLAPEVPKLLPRSRWSPSRLLERNAERDPERIALLFEERRYTWREVDEAANRWSHFFRRRGVGKGDVVALMMDNRPDFLFAEHGAGKLGAVVALVNTHLVGRPLAHALRIAGAKLCVIGAEHEEAVAAIAAEIGRDGVVLHVDDSAPASPHAFPVVNHEVHGCPGTRPTGLPVPLGSDPTSYIYTSGTTGLPKAARIANARFVGGAAMFGRVMYDAHPGDVIYVALPLYHSNGQWMGWGACLLTGATLALRRRFSASHFFADVRRYRATHFLYIGELCRYLLNAPPDPEERNHRLRMGVGNGLRKDVWTAFQRRFGVPLLREFYGATEGNAILTNVEGRPGMIGRLAPLHAVLACDPETGEPRRGPRGLCIAAKPGETGLFVAVISPLTRFDGYLDAAATATKVIRDVRFRGDAWFNSGDLMTVHDDGWVSFADRVGDTFRWKGENVSTHEVAEVLTTAGGVKSANVYGVTVPGAEGRAGMAALEIDASFDLDAFGAFVARQLPAYQRPLFLRILHEPDPSALTGTLKQKKVSYRDEGYDPARVRDPLYFLDGNGYLALDGELRRRIDGGELPSK